MNKLVRVSYKCLNVLVILLMVFGSPMSAAAYVWTEPTDYPPGSMVAIQGDNSDGAAYVLGEAVHVDVVGPNGYISVCDAIVGAPDSANLSYLYWSCNVTLWDSALAEGTYTYTATSASGVVEEGTFTDAKGYYHWQDEGSIGWNNNILNDNKSNYFEGEVVPHVFVYSSSGSDPLINGNSYTFTITYNYYEPNQNAGGFVYITTYNISRAAAKFASGTPITDATFTNNGGTQGNFATVNADVTSVSPVTYSGNIDGNVTITFTYTGSGGEAEIYFGLKIARPGEVPIQDTAKGPTKGASGWTGGSLQTNTSGTSLQLQPGAVIAGTISGYKWSDANGNGTFDSESKLSSWTINLCADSACATVLQTATTDASGYFSFSVTPSTYYVREVLQTGWRQMAPAGGFYGPLTVNATTFSFTANNFGNQQLGTIVVKKVATGGNDTFSFTTTGGNGFPAGFNITTSGGTGSQTYSNIVPGSYSVAETSLTDWTLTSSSCDTGTPAGFTLAAGGTVTCTFNNTKQVRTLSLTKTASPLTYSTVGESISYSYEIKNTGNVDLSGPFSITDDKATVTCTQPGDGILSPNETMSCSATYTITQADLDASSVTNKAKATNGSVYSNEATATVTAVVTRTMSLTKTATPATYDTVGQTISYSYVIKNTGNVTLSGPFTVSDDKAADEACPATPASLAPGGTVTCTASYIITQADLDAGKVTNKATATNGSVTSNEATATVNAIQTRELSLAKSATPTTYSVVGEIISYSFVVKNTGNITLAGPFTVNDDILGAVSCPAGSLSPLATVTCTATHTITQADLDAGSITNHATATDGTLTSNQAQATVTANQTKALTLDKTAQETTYAQVGDVLHYSYLVTNSGNVTLHDAITVTDNKATVTCPALPAGGLAPGASISCTASYTISQADLDAGSVTNLAYATSGTTKSNTDTVTVSGVQSPALMLDKTTTTTTFALAGDVIDYSYLLTNTGNVTLSGPFSATDDKVSASCPSAASLLPGATLTCTGAYTVTQADLDAGSVTNVAKGHASFNGNPVDSNQDSVTVTATQTPAISLTKTATPNFGTPVKVGDTISYSLVATNDGNVTLSNVTISDALLGTLTCTPAQPATLAPGASLTCTGSYTLTQNDIDAGEVINTAVVTSIVPGGGTGPRAQASSDVPIPQSPQIGLTKLVTESQYSEVGQTLHYTLVATNNGNVTLSNVSISDPLLGSLNCTPAQPATLAPGASLTCTGTHTVTQADLDAGQVSNTATVNGTGPKGQPVSDTASAKIIALQNTALTLTKTATPNFSNPVKVGDTINYTLVAQNVGNITLHSVTITDVKLGVLTCGPLQPATLAPGATLTCTGSYAITQVDIDAGKVDNIGIATSDRTPPTETPNDVPVPQNPHLTLVKTATPNFSTPVKVGDTISYQLVATNDGNVTLNTVSISDALLGTLTCTPPQPATLAPGAALTCTGSHALTQADLDAGHVANTAFAASKLPGGDKGPGGEDGEDVTVPQNPHITLAKSVTESSYDAPGEVLHYTLVATNDGNVTLHAVSISDLLLGGLTCSPAQPATLAPGESLTCTGTYKVTQADVDAGQVLNTATVTAKGPQDQPTSDTDSSNVPAIQTPAITLVKTVTSEGPYDSVGNVITYELVATNTGNVTLTNVSISDPKLGTLNCTPPQPATLAPAGTLTCMGSYKVLQADLDAGFVNNTATATGSFGNTNVSASDSQTVEMTQLPGISLTKDSVTHFSDPPKAGDTIDYTLTATNTGNITLTNVTITDALLGTLTCTPAQPATLAPNATLVCTGTYAITQVDINAGKVDNTGIVTSDQTPPTDTPHEDIVPQFPDISLVKTVTSSGPYDSVGDVITYKLVATNTGNVTLSSVSISDPKLGALDCTPTQPATLTPAGTLTCTGSYTVAQADLDAGKVDNTATVTGSFGGKDFTDTDSQTVTMTQNPAISLDKVTSDDTTSGDGLNILAGEAIKWKYVATNTGNVTLTDVSITDDHGLALICGSALGKMTALGGSISRTTAAVTYSLAPGSFLSCYAIGTAAVGSYSNNGTVTAKAPSGDPVTASDGSSYFGASPNLSIVKVTVDGATTGDALNILTGESISWKYTVTNTGNVALSNVTVTDNQPGVTVTCPKTSLALSESMDCTATGTAITGSYNNIGTASGKYTDSAGHTSTISGTDTSSYFGNNPKIDIIKKTVGSDGTEGDNVFILVGGTVTWKFYVTNTGNTALSNVSVTDNKIGAVTCPKTSLAVGESMTCTATAPNATPLGTWYSNTAIASGSYTDTAGHTRTVTDTDGSAYYSQMPGMVTNSSLCDFGTNFTLVFTPDVKFYTSSTPAYKLSDSNPGQFFYNIFQTGGTGTVTLTLPYPFVTQGATPIHVYTGLTAASQGGQTCLVPSNEIKNYQTLVTLANYSPANTYGSTTQVTLTGLPTSGFMYINIHLDYGLEKLNGWIKQGSNANYNLTINPTMPKVNILNNTAHIFNSSITGSKDTIYNVNSFKSVKGFGGLVTIKTKVVDGVNVFEELRGATVLLYNSAGQLLETMTTDGNGWYLSKYIPSGKSATFKLVLKASRVTIDGLTYTFTSQEKLVITGGANKFGEGAFQITPQ